MAEIFLTLKLQILTDNPIIGLSIVINNEHFLILGVKLTDALTDTEVRDVHDSSGLFKKKLKLGLLLTYTYIRAA